MAYMEDEIVIDDTPNVEVDAAPEAEPETVDPAKLIEQNKKLYARAKVAEAKLKQFQPTPLPATPAQPSPTDAIIDNLTVLKSLETDEIEELRSEARELGIDVIKYIKSKSGQSHLSTLRKAKQSEDANPEIGAKSPVYKKHTMDDLSAMTAQEIEQILRG